MALTELKGFKGDPQRIVVEHGPVRVFAEAILDADPVYRGDAAPVPPTFPFTFPYWGTEGQGGAAGLPVDRLRGPGRMILHGEQEFEYRRWPRVGDELEGVMTITDVSEKERTDGGKLEFYVTETDWTDVATGELVVKAIFTMVVNCRPPK